MVSTDKAKKTPGTARRGAAKISPDARAQQQLCILGPHGSMQPASVIVNSYSLDLRDGEGFIGDLASSKAFRRMLDAWRALFAAISGKDPLGAKPTRDLSKRQIDAMLHQAPAAASAIEAASEDYALQLAHVMQRFLHHKSWRGVERIVLGGGFHQSEVGARCVQRVAQILEDENVKVQLRTLHHHSDDGGLIGWVHLAPPALLHSYDAILAVDIGGTNVRCGIVQTHLHRAPDMSEAEVIGREKWTHADDQPRRDELVDGIAGRLQGLVELAARRKITLAPYVGVACPGLIEADGSIAGGTQNLPGNWESTRFHLPRDLCGRVPHIGGGRTQVCLHNDAVVQGLSELPYTQDVQHWAVLTVGTGLGNASYTNRRDPPTKR